MNEGCQNEMFVAVERGVMTDTLWGPFKSKKDAAIWILEITQSGKGPFSIIEIKAILPTN